MKRNLFLLVTLMLIAVFSFPAFALGAPGEPDNDQSQQSANKATEKPTKKSNSRAGESVRPFSLVGISANISTLGIGGQFGTALSRRVNMRFGFNAFNYSRDFDRDGLNYSGTLGLKSLQAMVDFFPFRGFHISPGLLVYNGNKLEAKVSVPTGQTFDLGDATYRSGLTPITGSGKLSFNQSAPMVLFGFGNVVPRTRHFSVNMDIGVAFHGTPKVTMGLAGLACDTSGLNCANIATDATAQSNLQAELKKLNNSASPYKVWPIISMGIGYRF